YGPEPGYDFLTELIAARDYGERGITVSADEVFVSDGGKSDSANIQEIFALDCVVAVMDPVYPVYVDSNVMAGRGGNPDEAGRYSGFVYLPCTAENGFQPALPSRHVDLIYLCYPNNPTGAVMTHETLARWIEYARRERAVILYDAAYEAYVREAGVPRSIYEVAGAREVAVEFRSFSKTAGFTGTRCAFTVVPKELQGRSATGEAVSLNALWLRRQSTKFNSVPYIVQRAAAAVYTDEGRRQVRSQIDYYMDNAAIIRSGVEAVGLTAYGGRNAPYIWVKMPRGLSSWDFFDKLLNEAHVVGTPGAGLGPSGGVSSRPTAFGRRNTAGEASHRKKNPRRLEPPTPKKPPPPPPHPVAAVDVERGARDVTRTVPRQEPDGGGEIRRL